MRQFLLLPGFAAGFLLLAPGCGVAQVIVNPAALQQLAGIEPPPPVPAEVPAVVPVAAPVHHWVHRTHPPAAQSAGTVQASARVTAPPAPPKPAASSAKPIAPAAPKPLAPVTLAFAPGSADLPANATMALKPYCTSTSEIAIDGRAPADPSDLSAAMRLSLSRAMAVQAALTSCGVPETKILPRAQGAVPGQNENDVVVGSGIQ